MPRNQGRGDAPFVGQIAFDLLAIASTSYSIDHNELGNISLEEISIC